MIAYRKTTYPVAGSLLKYLGAWGRHSTIPVIYEDLLRFSGSIPYEDKAGNETLWQTVMYSAQEWQELRPKLTQIYAQLKIGGDMSFSQHLEVDRVDFGDFGNSKPFRVRIVNRFNDNFDHYYVKRADASRIYGLELEHILSPNRINFLVNEGTLIEEHIAGVPGDVFIRDYLNRADINKVRVAKEFVKFNERSFLRLLGDMRTVNYVIDITPDFEEVQYRVRPIDFDQQSYEGRHKVYLAQFFRDNFPIVKLVTDLLNTETIRQYQKEERTLMARRRRVSSGRLSVLLRVMCAEELSPIDHVVQLREELADVEDSNAYEKCKTMGEIVKTHMEVMLVGL
ncbi:MAG: hypothetical protein ACI9R3_002341 [Verrucomicrobiales bacterium]|jgi:hypothetical protein